MRTLCMMYHKRLLRQSTIGIEESIAADARAMVRAQIEGPFLSFVDLASNLEHE